MKAPIWALLGMPSKAKIQYLHEVSCLNNCIYTVLVEFNQRLPPHLDPLSFDALVRTVFLDWSGAEGSNWVSSVYG